MKKNPSGGERTSNNFDFIRLFAASLVVAHHSFALLGKPDSLQQITNNQYNFGSLGVYIFFIISGYLITQSLFRSQNYKTYFAKRSLRIFPALIVHILLAVFLFGLLLTTLPLKDYFADWQTYRYLGNICLYTISYELPGVFKSNPVPAIVNGSLWTLGYEFTCYIGVVILHALFLLKGRVLFLCGYLSTLFAWLFFQNTLSIYAILFTGLTFSRLIPLSLYFGAGMLFYLFRDKIILSLSAGGLLLLSWAVAFYFGRGESFAFLVLPYIVLSFVFRQNSILGQTGRLGDFSYGTYIYSFPIQQFIVQIFNANISIGLLILLSFLFTIPFAMFSWFVIERRALRLKDRLFPPLH